MRSVVKAFVLVSVLSLATSQKALAGPLGGPSDGQDGSVNQTSNDLNLSDPAANATLVPIPSDSNVENPINGTMVNSTGAILDSTNSTTMNTTDSGNITLSDAAPGSNATSSTEDSFGSLASLNATNDILSNSTDANSTTTNSANITDGSSKSTVLDGSASLNDAFNANATLLTDDASSNNTVGLFNETLASVNGTSSVSNSTDDTSGSKGSFSIDNSTSLLSVNASNGSNATLSFNSKIDGANSTAFNITSNSTLGYSGAVGSVRTFVLSQNISWSDKDFKIYDNSGPIAYVITKVEGMNATSEDIIVKVGSTGEKKLQVDAYPGKCGKETDWLADDGTKITLDPRGLLSDRWYIKNPAFPKPQYTFLRNIFDLGGEIVESNSSRLVGSITKQKLKSTLPNLPFTTDDKVFVVTNNGFIPDWDLLTMLALAVQHHKKCFY
ncbi:hypothetical protein DFH28DRAFT_979101 [Melampsora americana]|nr:hypothetical protein DFH28DRAFT_1067880 [Melampsora americana]KAH9812197.1 hypothetical protein DFH28DRAFT_979101 [Melampsora americana]